MEITGVRKKGPIREYGEALLTALLVAFLVRSFVVEAFKIPSGSMIPTLMIGDHIFVNKFTYGLRIPFTKKRIVTFRSPERGEAVVFIYPVDESKDFIKRVTGLPGDRISIHGDRLIVNGKTVMTEEIQVSPEGSSRLKIIPEAKASEAGVHSVPVFPGWDGFRYWIETLGEVKHLVQFDQRPSYEDLEIVVPPGHFFVMGDNRDNSSDSRDWGFVPIENLKGKAMFVWLSIDYDRKTLRWNRFGKWIQ